MALGRNTVHKLGKRVREAYGDGTGQVATEDLQMLQEYRLEYRDTIAKIFKILYETSKQVDAECIVTYRIKRINSIIEKLKRFPTTALDQMIDIAGCRCITHNTEQVYTIIERLQQNPKLTIQEKDNKDYIKNPQPEGYRSVHLFVSLSDGDGKQVEIQIRNQEQHNWATLVEISDVIIPEARLKEYSEPKDLLEFHRILSIPEEDLTEEERRKYFDVLEKYDYINLLQKVFLQNTSIRYQWLNTKSSAIKNFFLIEAGVDAKTKMNCYQTFQEAENAYFERFLQDTNANIVLTQIQNVSFEQISMAYSNYVLSTHNFTSDCMNRYLKEIKYALKNQQFNLYKKTINSYFNIVAQQIIRINSELKTIKENKFAQQSQKKRDWIRDLNIQISTLMTKKERLTKIYRETLKDRSFFYYRCKFYTNNLAKHYDEIARNGQLR